jgi:hypothetical protein
VAVVCRLVAKERANEVSSSDIDIVAMKMANLLMTTMFAVSLKFEQSNEK